MKGRSALRISLAAVALLIFSNASSPRAITQSAGRTLKGEWVLSFSPIDDQLLSRKGNSLGFADRHIELE